jgi:glycosyltransferase involved in cell wall biosynthesis
MKISIVIPSLNCAKYLPRTLDSIFNQSYKDFEVIVVDGYSTDGTHGIIKDYKMVHGDKLRIIYRKPLGQSDAINQGMFQTIGDIVTYLNADDTYNIECLGRVNRYFEMYGDLQWVYGKGNIIDKDGDEVRGLVTNLKGIVQPRYSYTALQCVCFIVQPTVFMRKSFYHCVGEFNTELKYSMDYDYWLRAGQLSTPMFIDKHLANWRCHSEALSVREYSKQAQEAFDIQKRYSSKWLRLIQWKVKVLTNMLYGMVK